MRIRKVLTIEMGKRILVIHTVCQYPFKDQADKTEEKVSLNTIFPLMEHRPQGKHI